MKSKLTQLVKEDLPLRLVPLAETLLASDVVQADLLVLETGQSRLSDRIPWSLDQRYQRTLSRRSKAQEGLQNARRPLRLLCKSPWLMIAALMTMLELALQMHQQGAQSAQPAPLLLITPTFCQTASRKLSSQQSRKHGSRRWMRRCIH